MAASGGDGGDSGGAAGGGAGGSGELTIAQAMEMGIRFLREDRIEGAAEIYRRVLAAAPDHVDAMHFLALASFQLERHDEAVALLRRVLALVPDHADAHNNLGNMLFARGDLPGAEAAYRAVLALRPAHAAAHTNLAVIARRRGDREGAEAQFRAALEIDPRHWEALHQLADLFADVPERFDESIALFRRAMEIHPYDAKSLKRLGAVLYGLDRVSEAEAVYKKWLEQEPDNPEAQHLVAACSGKGVPERASDAFVQRTFDTFAGSFDEVLTRLQYRAPELTTQAVAALVGAPARSLDILDAGAGTGLCGVLLRPYARRLVGVDLSRGMLDKAAERKLYDELEVAELVAFMRGRPLAFDVIVSADTLVYFGELGAAFATASAALRPGGHLVFTVERAQPNDGDAEGGFRLNPHGRYSHTESYLRRELTAAGLTPLSLTPVELRQEAQRPVHGLLVAARREQPRKEQG